MADKVLAMGFFGRAPRANAPAFVKGSVSINVKTAIQFLNENANEKGYVNLDLLENKTDPAKWNVFLDTFAPKAKDEAAVSAPVQKGPAAKDDDGLPF